MNLIINRLEDTLGVKLLERTKRKETLTEAAAAHLTINIVAAARIGDAVAIADIGDMFADAEERVGQNLVVDDLVSMPRLDFMSRDRARLPESMLRQVSRIPIQSQWQAELWRLMAE